MTRSFVRPALVLAMLVLPSMAHAQVIGKAGPVELTDAELRRLVAALPKDTRAALVADDAALERFVRSELARRLLLADAKTKAFDRDPAVAAEFDRLRDEALLRAWLERQSRVPDGYPSEAEVAGAYEAAVARQAPLAEYRLAQIFIAVPDGAPPAKVADALKKSAEIQSRLASGDFAQLARQYSEHAESASKGGDLGLLPETRLLPEVRAAVSGLAVGAVAGPLKTAQGFHFIRLVEKKASPVPPLTDVRAGLVAALREQKAAELQREYVAKLGQGGSISVNQVELGRLRSALQ
jgi:peptidylprolyl isomerase